MDAIDILISQHRKIDDLFAKWKSLGTAQFSERKKIAEDVMRELIMHTQIEERFFYPFFETLCSQTCPISSSPRGGSKQKKGKKSSFFKNEGREGEAKTFGFERERDEHLQEHQPKKHPHLNSHPTDAEIERREAMAELVRMIGHSLREHREISDTILVLSTMLAQMGPSGNLGPGTPFDREFSLLVHQVQHHATGEEEGKMFPLIRNRITPSQDSMHKLGRALLLGARAAPKILPNFHNSERNLDVLQRINPKFADSSMPSSSPATGEALAEEKLIKKKAARRDRQESINRIIVG